jgi:hypothetical protein
MYHSVIIEESLKNPKVLGNYRILRTKLSPKQNWHLHVVEIPKSINKTIKEVQNALKEDAPYYFHTYDEGQTLIVVFKEKTFQIDPTDKSTWKQVRKYGASKLSIPPQQLDFYPSKISEEDDWFTRN